MVSIYSKRIQRNQDGVDQQPMRLGGFALERDSTFWLWSLLGPSAVDLTEA